MLCEYVFSLNYNIIIIMSCFRYEHEFCRMSFVQISSLLLWKWRQYCRKMSWRKRQQKERKEKKKKKKKKEEEKNNSNRTTVKCVVRPEVTLCGWQGVTVQELTFLVVVSVSEHSFLMRQLHVLIVKEVFRLSSGWWRLFFSFFFFLFLILPRQTVQRKQCNTVWSYSGTES